ncbi:hypothetical protein NQD34_008743 [Periophthalmus magnuspinnatus]|nr:hypothetical protein NQD34_008743 [Periophthalmus magnuspinnatus]
MSRLERLRALVNQRINAAADDIGRILEGKVSEYEEEVRFFREENNSLQHKILQLASKSDVQIVVMDEDEAEPSENQEQPTEEDSDEASASSAPVCEEEKKTAPKRTRRGRKSNTKDCETPGTSSDKETEGTQRPKSKRTASQPEVSKAKRRRN